MTRSWTMAVLKTFAIVIAAAAMAACAQLPAAHGVASSAIARVEGDPLEELSRPCFDDGARSCFRALPNSAFSMDARLALAARASHSIDVQYYLLQDDRTGRLLLSALRDASQRGVRVRVLVDDLYTADNETLLRDLAAWPNVEIRLFNPFVSGRSYTSTRWLGALTDFARINHRMHNKLFVVDGVFAVAGGRNIADEYFFKSGEGNFIDFDILLSGPAVTELESAYDRYWNSSRVFPLAAFDSERPDAAARRAEFNARLEASESPFPKLASDAKDALGQASVSAELAQPPVTLLRGKVQVWVDDPEKVTGRSESGLDESTVTSHMLAEVRAAKTDVKLVSPYFVPSELGMATLQDVRDHNVSASLLTNSMAANDEVFVSAAYARYRERLLKMGIEIWEISPHKLGEDKTIGPELGRSKGRMHAKLLVIDHRTTFVGSMNLDLRSSRENTELGLLIDSPELASEVEQLVQGVKEFGSYSLRLNEETNRVQWVERDADGVVVYDDEPDVGALTKLKVWLLSPFIGQSLL